MLKKIVIPLSLFCFAQFVVADIATDISNGVGVNPTTQNAKNDNVVQEEAIEELIQAGVNCIIAVQAVRNIYNLSVLETDSIITAAINIELVNADQECANVAGDNSYGCSRICPTKPLIALYSTGMDLDMAIGPSSTRGIGDVGSGGGGSCLGNVNCSVSPN